MPDVSRAYGGPTHTLLGLLQASRDQTIETTVVSLDCPDKPWLCNQAPDTDWQLFDFIGKGSLRYSHQMTSWLKQNLSNYDAVHIHGLFNLVSTLTARLAIKKKVKTIIRPFGTLSRYTFSHNKPWLKKWWFHFLDKQNLVSCHRVHFMSEGELQESFRLFKIQPPSTVIGSPCIFAIRAPSEDVQRRRFRVLFLSRIHPIKKLECLIEAWPLVLASIPNAELVITGDGNTTYVDQIKAMVKDKGLDQSVSFTGFVSGDEKAALLAQCSLLVQPSSHENLGISILEAISFGLAVVVSKGVHIHPWIIDQGLGAVCGATSANLAETISAALNDAELLNHCQTAGYDIVSEYFSVHVIGEKIKELYQNQ